jgi:hypothetical protein
MCRDSSIGLLPREDVKRPGEHRITIYENNAAFFSTAAQHTDNPYMGYGLSILELATRVVAAPQLYTCRQMLHNFVVRLSLQFTPELHYFSNTLQIAASY